MRKITKKKIAKSPNSHNQLINPYQSPRMPPNKIVIFYRPNQKFTSKYLINF